MGQCLDAGQAKSPPSKARIRLCEKLQLFGAGLTTQDRIAVRITAESIDDPLVFILEFEAMGIAQGFKKLDGLLVNETRFAVHEWHVEKTPFCRRKRPVKLFRDSTLRESQSHGVTEERLGLSPVNIPGELVQDDDFREASGSRFAPCTPFASHGLLVPVSEAPANQSVELLVLLPPLRRLEFAEPEVEDFLVHSFLGLSAE